LKKRLKISNCRYEKFLFFTNILIMGHQNHKAITLGAHPSLFDHNARLLSVAMEGYMSLLTTPEYLVIETFDSYSIGR